MNLLLRRREARWAQLIDRFSGLRPCHLAELTEAQIDRLYYARRDVRSGHIIFPEEVGPTKPLTVEAHIATYLKVAKAAKFPAQVIEARIAAIRRHHERKSHASPSSNDSPHAVPGRPE